MNRCGKRDGDGWSPDFPDSVTGFRLLADGRATMWGLYRYSLEGDVVWEPPHPATDSIEALIESGIRYPPALALTRKAISVAFCSKESSREDFEREYVRSLSDHLSSQSDSGYVLAPAIIEEFGYLGESEWYWVLKCTEDSPSKVYWVSDDYHIYCNAATDFLLTEEQLERLRKNGWD